MFTLNVSMEIYLHDRFSRCKKESIVIFIYLFILPEHVSFFQGMNEILGPIYYTFASDPEKDCKGKHYPKYNPFNMLIVIF